jgi:predicted aspartyl protease
MSDLVRSYKMDNVTFIEVEEPTTGELVEHAIIDRGNGEFTSMPKSVYDAQQAALMADE